MKDGFAGIEEKLIRADENIRNLDSEVARFFEKCKYPVLPKLEDKRHSEAVEYFKKLLIPIRFSVLSGEIVHHLRSCLDHIIWELSDDPTRNFKDGRYLEFPILDTRPTPENKFTRYDRKIQGVQHSGALKLIEKLQPYNSVTPHTELLWVIHDMDRTDKHRELVIVQSTGFMQGSWDLVMKVRGHLTRGTVMPEPLMREFDKHGEITPQVSFKEFSGWIFEPIVPVLAQLLGCVRSVVFEFERAIT